MESVVVLDVVRCLGALGKLLGRMVAMLRKTLSVSGFVAVAIADNDHVNDHETSISKCGYSPRAISQIDD